jgi:uncharacterized protein DUF6073
MRKRTLFSLLAVVGCLVVLVSLVAATSQAPSDQSKIASLVNDMNTMGSKGLANLKPIAIRPFELPTPGVDVMRARLHETYSVDGVGTDTVELSGWIAVRHSAPYPAPGEKDLSWNTAVTDTEFVAMDLHGHSKVFGPVNVTLDKERPSLGQVGRVQIPDAAKVTLLAKLEKNDAAPQKAGAKAEKPAAGKSAAPGKSAADKPKAAAPAAATAPAATAKPIDDSNAAVVCEAPVNVSVVMPDLKLEMKTDHHVIWYSLVDTIPPVGHTASVAIEPVRLIANGRAVATLESGIVDFREVVRHVPLSDSTVAVAAKH